MRIAASTVSSPGGQKQGAPPGENKIIKEDEKKTEENSAKAENHRVQYVENQIVLIQHGKNKKTHYNERYKKSIRRNRNAVIRLPGSFKAAMLDPFQNLFQRPVSILCQELNQQTADCVTERQPEIAGIAAKMKIFELSEEKISFGAGKKDGQ